MLADKMRHVLDTGAEICTAGDSSCLMHIGGGLSRIRAGAKTVHLAQILAATREKPVVLGRAERQAEVPAGPEVVL
jgi:L-lactate dehydrogenase complex protein LldE